MKRTEEDLPKDYVLEQRVVGEKFSFHDFTVDTDYTWDIHSIIHFSENQPNGVIYTHIRTGRPFIIMTENKPNEYQACYMQKMVDEETGFEREIHCFDIFSSEDMVKLLELLDQYYCTEMCHVDENRREATVNEMIAFLRQDSVNTEALEEEEEVERKIVKAKRVADSDKM